MEKYCVVVDVETTGLMKDRDLVPNKSNLSNFPYIVEMAWVVLSEDGGVISKGEYLLKQKYKIPAAATKIHGITNKDCEENGHEAAEVFQKFASDISGCLRLVGHNIMFDKRIIEANCLREEIKKPFKGMTNYDTMKMGKSYLGLDGWPKLGELYEEITERPASEYDSHRAAGDVAMTAQIFFVLKSAGNVYAPKGHEEPLLENSHFSTINTSTMNKYQLQGKLKNTNQAYLFWFFLGAHYAYQGRWGMQFLYWFTLGGLGLWMIIDAFRMGGMIEKYNASIYEEMENLEKREKDEDQARQMAMIAAARG